MNLLWFAGLSVVVIIEKMTPLGRTFGWAIGAVLLTLGTVLVVWPQWISEL
jgi:predicted metal-binding membrane protein